jgi:hypothetical protein
MRCGRYYLRQGYIFLLLWFLGTFAYTPLSTATDPHLLKDVSVVYQDGQWHVVLTGSKAMTYRVLKAFTPLRLVVDLIDTLNEISPSPTKSSAPSEPYSSLVSLNPEPKSRLA